jgi:hypothetical protein
LQNLPTLAGPKPSRWHQLTDDELLDVSFLSNDPSSLDNLLTEFPEGKEMPEVEFAYDTTLSTGSKVRCVHCKFENHNRGFVLQYSDGSRILVGGTCGKNRYGADFQSVERDFAAAQERASYLRRRQQTLAAADRFKRLLAELCEHSAFGAYRKVKRDFNRTMAPLALVLSGLSNDGRLFLSTKVRDHSAEDRRYEAWEKRTKALSSFELSVLQRDGRNSPPKGHMYKQSEEPFWSVAGLPYFRVSAAPDEVLRSLSQRIDSALGVLELKAEKTSDLRVFFKAANALLSQIDGEVARLSDMSRALDAKNLAKLAEWASRRLDKSYKFDGLVLTRRDDESDPQTFRVPFSAGLLPDTSFVEEFRTALNTLSSV